VTGKEWIVWWNGKPLLYEPFESRSQSMGSRHSSGWEFSTAMTDSLPQTMIDSLPQNMIEHKVVRLLQDSGSLFDYFSLLCIIMFFGTLIYGWSYLWQANHEVLESLFSLDCISSSQL
jgi:hypothetical protein